MAAQPSRASRKLQCRTAPTPRHGHAGKRDTKMTCSLELLRSAIALNANWPPRAGNQGNRDRRSEGVGPMAQRGRRDRSASRSSAGGRNCQSDSGSGRAGFPDPQGAGRAFGAASRFGCAGRGDDQPCRSGAGASEGKAAQTDRLLQAAVASRQIIPTIIRPAIGAMRLPTRQLHSGCRNPLPSKCELSSAD